MRILWTGVFAIVMTALVSGIWAALLLTNLSHSPGLPWSSIIMAVILWAFWAYLNGRWAPASTRDARRMYLRAAQLPRRVYSWALVAGLLWVVFLAGFWIVLGQLVALPGNKLPDLSTLPVLTVIATLVVACASGAISEEAGFRGYFQGSLERAGLGAAAILCTALLMAPIHALTQGFVWPTLVFYLLVDAMLGALAYFTKSILPGVVVHAVGLFTFLGLIWPGDKARSLISQGGTDLWFWIHLAQAILFGALSLYALYRLAMLTQQGAQALSAPAEGRD
jgi:membrane protease YdiL (CAAX protease family)